MSLLTFHFEHYFINSKNALYYFLFVGSSFMFDLMLVRYCKTIRFSRKKGT